MGCAVAVESEDESEPQKHLRKVMGVSKPKSTLTFLQCLEALHRYVVIASACKQFALASGMTHIMIVMKVASLHGQHVAVAYDERAREKWASAAHYAGMSGRFSVDEAMCKLDEAVVALALAKGRAPAESLALGPAARQPASRAEGKGKEKEFDGSCNFCGKQGHRKADCFQRIAQAKRGFDSQPDEGPDRKRRGKN